MDDNCLMGQNSYLYDKDLYSLLQPPSPVDLSPSPSPAACGFMELLNHQLSFESLSSDLDGMSHQITYPTPSVTTPSTKCSSVLLEASEVSNQFPATPNSSSISSASNDDHNLAKQEEHEDQDPKNKTCTKQPLKAKKTNQKKKQKEARIAFMTKSEVDHLEDGYRWRKYGQKAVKNSSFPRSYYRCTSTACNVKKRVERCFNDPSIVITTYEGQHIHPSPIMAQSRLGFPATTFSSGISTAGQPQMNTANIGLRAFSNYFPHNNNNYVNGNYLPISTNPLLSSSGGGDNGLLQDIVPSNVYHDGQ